MKSSPLPTLLITAVAVFILQLAPTAHAQAQFTTPTLGSSLPYPTFTLTWPNTGAAEYFIYIGSQQGSYSYYGASLARNTSATLNWPTGRPVGAWFRLWSKVNVYSGTSGSTVAYSYWTWSDRYYRLDQQNTSLNYNWKLPFPKGFGYVCTAGVAGPNSHHTAENYYSLDFARGTNSPRGDIPVYALHAGRVVEVFSGALTAGNTLFNKWKADALPLNGYFVRIDADGDDNQSTGLVSIYCHMKYPPNLRRGDWVAAGSQIGVMGNTGDSSGEHLHLGLKFNGSSRSPNTELLKIRIEGLLVPEFVARQTYYSTR